MFKAHTGVSFMQYLTHYRIDKARELMREGKYKVYEISEMVGYPDPSYFCRVFKNVTGQPPTEYMARLHGGAVKGTSAH
jgi:YesN/AraC family two-component response regulator